MFRCGSGFVRGGGGFQEGVEVFKRGYITMFKI
jgi:hypothetical protein